MLSLIFFIAAKPTCDWLLSYSISYLDNTIYVHLTLYTFCLVKYYWFAAYISWLCTAGIIYWLIWRCKSTPDMQMRSGVLWTRSSLRYKSVTEPASIEYIYTVKHSQAKWRLSSAATNTSCLLLQYVDYYGVPMRNLQVWQVSILF